MANVTMTYGDYEFSPVPFLNMSKQFAKSGNEALNVGVTFRVTLRGTLTPLPVETSGGLDKLDELQDELRAAFSVDGRPFEVMCGETTIIRTCPRIISINFDESNNNWVFTTPYTIELEYDWDDYAEDSQVPPFIESFDESWQIDMEQESRHFSWDLGDVADQDGDAEYPEEGNAPFIVRINHTVTAKGKRTFDCVGASGDIPGDFKSAADNALDWLNGYSFSPAQTLDSYSSTYAHALSGVINMETDDFTATDHFRSSTVNESDGTVSMSETWIVVGETGINSIALEDFDVNVRESIGSSLKSISINGTIKGYVTQSYADPEATGTYSVDTQAYTNALTYWETIKPRIFSRAQLVYERDYDNRVNPRPLGNSSAHMPSKGIISYQYEYDDRPCNFISGALTEDFSISDNFPTDVFATLTVLGRPQGPILQSIGTVTAPTREVSIDVVMPQPTGCSSISELNLYKPRTQVADLLCEFEGELTSEYSQVFKTSDTESWSPKSGHYSRRVSWTMVNCSGDISTSFC